MFQKSYKVKSNAPLKSSDVKKLRQRIQKDFPMTNPEVFIAPKSTVNMLKLVTHGGFQTNVYCVDKIPMFFENENNALVPTVYSLWQVPDILPYFTTFFGVIPKLSNGADLMLPGVVPQGTGVHVFGNHKKGQLVAVNLTSNKYAVGVGYLLRSSDDLYRSGGRGVAVKMLHLFGDKLWAHEPSLAKQIPQYKTTILTKDDFPALESKQCHRKEYETHSECKNELPNVEKKDQIETLEDVPSEVLPTDSLHKRNDLENLEKTSESTPDKILKHAFLSALKNNGKNLQLPLLTSNFYRLYVVPESDEPLDLKKTKYKKLSNFLNEMIDEGFIVVREETKGVDIITSIDLEHPELINFVTDFKKKENSGNPLFHSELTELYVITDVAAPFFTKLNYKRGSGIPASEIKNIVREYISKQNLIMSKNTIAGDKTYVLDECLEKICNDKVASLNRIINVLISHMDHSYQMCNTNDVKMNKPLIKMSLANRLNNKKITLVSNIEYYGIILAEFIKLCKQGAAASATIVTLPNQNREMLQIQGNQIRFVYNLLTQTYKIPPRCILGLELAKDGKKNKNKQTN